MADGEEIGDEAMVNAARRLYQEDGKIEIDTLQSPLPDGRVSRGNDPGAYVLAWVWVRFDQVTPEDSK